MVDQEDLGNFLGAREFGTQSSKLKGKVVEVGSAGIGKTYAKRAQKEVLAEGNPVLS